MINSNDIYNFLRPLTPTKLIDPSKKIRLGSTYDGGYVLYEPSLPKVDVLYSYGIENDITFEKEFCTTYGVVGRLYDHTIDKIPEENNNLYFTKEGVGPEKQDMLNTVENHIIENGDQDKNLLLKMDVEGCEWQTLFEMSDQTLKKFQQIAIEIHHMGSGNKTLADLQLKTAVLNKLSNLFQLYHVHANNCGDLFIQQGFKCPETLELTYVNKELLPDLGNTEYDVSFPTEFDNPNNPYMQEVILDYWPFCSENKKVEFSKTPFFKRKFLKLKHGKRLF